MIRNHCSYADLHCDTLGKCFDHNIDFSDRKLHIHSDLYKKFDRYLQVFAHFIPESKTDKWSYLKASINNSHRILKENGIAVFRNVEDLNYPKCALLSVENGDIFDCKSEEEIAVKLQFLRDQGIRFFSMIYNHDNSLGSGAFSWVDQGLTTLGIKVIESLEKYGIILDVSHASYRSTDDILNCSKNPVCATHSNAYTLCQHPRNLHDEHLRKIANKNGLIGINLYPPFLNSRVATIDDIVEQILFIVNICGIDHVSFGCDFDGMDLLPKGIKNASSIEKIYDRLRQRGVGADDVDKIYFNNVLNFIKANFGGN